MVGRLFYSGCAAICGLAGIADRRSLGGLTGGAAESAAATVRKATGSMGRAVALWDRAN
jgi:hypothetical protein